MRHHDGMVEPFRIHLADRLPVQQSQFTCGSASLIVARMFVDPVFARWVLHGASSGRHLPGGDTQVERAAALEQIVLARTNALIGPGGRLQLPWPRRLGTPPWGARHELEARAAESGVGYEIAWCRRGGEERLRRRYAQLRERVADGRPALLYIGNGWLPRHVTLVVPAADGDGLDVYDPATGQVQALVDGSFVARRLRLAGWDVPWCVVLAGPSGPASGIRG